MGNLFSELQKTAEKQRNEVQQLHASPPDQKVEVVTDDLKEVTQLSKRSSKPLSRRLSKNLSNLPTTEEIEDLAFRLRKTTKIRVNADIPADWKKKLDDLAFRLEVGKYDVLMYIVALFLQEVEEAEG